MVGYFFPDKPRSGAENMAIDEALLKFVPEFDCPVLRFYFWERPTLSLGYFQRYADQERYFAGRSIPAVRRRSGGGAIVHDRELTYSLVIPPEHAFARKQRLMLYETVHRAVVGALRKRGIKAELATDVPTARQGTEEEPFLCFQRFAPGDILARTNRGTIKIMGSAQYRNKTGAVLQHGSLLYDCSEAAPELPGLRQAGLTETEDESTDSGRWNFDRRFIDRSLAEDLFRIFQDRLSCSFSDFDEIWDRKSHRIVGKGATGDEKREFKSTIAFLEEKRYLNNLWLSKK